MAGIRGGRGHGATLDASVRTVIRGGLVVDGGPKAPRVADVAIAYGMIIDAAPALCVPAAEVIDATGCIVAPGFVDLQVNGGLGIDLTAEPERIGELARHLVTGGVTSFLPTIISTSPSGIQRAIAAFDGHRDRAPAGGPSGARALGLHLEGPFLNPTRAGAHPRHHLRPPDVEEARGWTGGQVALVTLAPELPGALEVVDLLVGRGIAVSAGHSAATAAEFAAAVGRGLSGVTHLYNAMAPFTHREPGIVGAVLAGTGLTVGVIVDGAHVDPAMVTVAWRALGPRQFALVSDAVAAAGLPDGRYPLGDSEVVVTAGVPRTPAGVLAGSTLAMNRAVGNLVAVTGCPVRLACASASSIPARLLGRRDIGRIGPGRPADIVVLSRSFDVVATIVGGQVVHDPHHRMSPR